MNSIEYKKLQIHTNELIFHFGVACDYLMNWNTDAAMRLLKALFPELGEFVNTIDQLIGDLEELGIHFSPQEVVPVIRNMMIAQEKQDYMELLSVIRSELLPKFQMLFWMMDEISVLERPDHLEQHMQVLEKCNPELYSLVRRYLESGNEVIDGIAYKIEVADNTQTIMKKKSQQDEFSFYSTDRPIEDMRSWVMNQIRYDVGEYHIFESGLLYAGRSLLRISGFTCRIHEYFTSLYMLVQSMRFGYYVPFIGKNIFLHYDPSLQQLTKAMQDPYAQTILYFPAIRDLENEQLKNAMMKYYVAENSTRVSNLLLNGNFYSNIRIPGVQNVDELNSCFEGKKVFIVAAGPSLDKNVDGLRELPENSVIIATGTIYRKLMKAGIKPDYVILSEANARVIEQLKVDEELRKQVPLILLSTATTDAYREYPGSKYMVYQYEYKPAEHMAKEQKRMLYMTGGSVSTLALDVAIRLGAKSVIFTGLDLAFTNHQAHSTGTSATREVDTTGMIEVPAINGGTVYADSKFLLYRDWFKRRLKMEDAKKIAVIDSTEGGAVIDGMCIMTLEDAKRF